MATIHEEQERLLSALAGMPEGATIKKLREVLPGVEDHNLRTRLAALVDAGKIQKVGKTRDMRYLLRSAPAEHSDIEPDERPAEIPLGEAARALRAALARPARRREVAGYDPDFLRRYIPGGSGYLGEERLDRLHALGRTLDQDALPGTYARRKHVYERLLIDLSWSSSYLEGSTLTRLDTERLLRELESETLAQTSDEALYKTITLNHKGAIDLLLSMEPQQLDISSTLIKRVHGQLSGGLLSPVESGHLRSDPAGIGIDGSTYIPLGDIAMIRSEFESLVEVSQEIEDPFEQSLFLLIHLPYLQPFQDVNKRTSRIVSNVPLIRANVCPISFVSVSRDVYRDAILGVYERCDVSFMVDLYMWAYERSCKEFSAMSLVVDDFLQRVRLKYATQLRDIFKAMIKDLFDVTISSDNELKLRVQSHLERRGLVLNSASVNDLITLIRHDAPLLHPGTIFYYNVTEQELSRWLAAQTPPINP